MQLKILLLLTGLVVHIHASGLETAMQNDPVMHNLSPSTTIFRINPFLIPFSPKDLLTQEDYVTVQKQLRAINLSPLLESLYPKEGDYALFQDFLGRCNRGLKQGLIHVSKAELPVQRLIRIGKGSSRCIVSCVSYNAHYPQLIQSIPAALEESGFNGYFLYQIGGFPNPTGMEIQYAGVPYCFKIFMMLEAANFGFDQILWIDSAVLPLKDPTPLFHWIDQTGSFLCKNAPHPTLKKYILPSTRDELKQLTGTDVLTSPYVCTILFGLDIRSPKAQQLITSYYTCVQLGTPFLSCFPEEFVLTALLHQSDYQDWKSQPFNYLLKSSENNEDTPERIAEAKNRGYFFYHRKLR